MSFDIEKLKERISYLEGSVAICTFVYPILREYHGKKITRRMFNKVKEALEFSHLSNITPYYSKQYDMFHLKFNWYDENNIYHQHSIHLGSNFFNNHIFDANDKLNDETIESWKKDIVKLYESFNKIKEWEDRYKNIQNELKEFKKDLRNHKCEYDFNFDFSYIPGE